MTSVKLEIRQVVSKSDDNITIERIIGLKNDIYYSKRWLDSCRYYRASARKEIKIFESDFMQKIEEAIKELDAWQEKQIAEMKEAINKYKQIKENYEFEKEIEVHL